MSVFDSFTPLEDLIQAIYQGLHRFVLLSKVDFDSIEPSWKVYLGLADGGRWWKGKWLEKDLHDFIGSNVSSELLQSFTENIANMMITGELFVGNWSAEKGAEIKVVFGPSEKRPLSIPLTEIPSEEAATFVANEFLSIALNAQSRKCQLNPPPFASIPVAHLPSSTTHTTNKRVSVSPPPVPATSSTLPKSKTKDRLHATSSKTAHEPEAVKRKEEQAATTKTKAPVAGPRKKARKVQKMEFGSDDE